MVVCAVHFVGIVCGYAQLRNLADEYLNGFAPRD
jgi:hypothetical protein